MVWTLKSTQTNSKHNSWKKYQFIPKYTSCVLYIKGQCVRTNSVLRCAHKASKIFVTCVLNDQNAHIPRAIKTWANEVGVLVPTKRRLRISICFTRVLLRFLSSQLWRWPSSSSACWEHLKLEQRRYLKNYPRLRQTHHQAKFKNDQGQT